MANDDRFNPASATREMFTEAITRALGDMTDAEIESLVQSAVGTEMSQRQMADLNLQSALESSVSAIRSELALKASTSDVTAAVADEAADRQAADETVYNSAAELVTDETAARQSADADLHDAVGVVAAQGAKNLLKLDVASQTVNGVTFTVNDDQTITVTGTAETSFPTTIGTVSGLSGDYILSGCPSGGSGSTYKMYRAGASSSSSQADIGEGYTYTFEPENTHAIRIYLYAGNTFNLTFKPMLRPAEITDATFVPYAPTNRELYEEKKQLQASIDQITGLEKQIPSNADLNAYSDPGVFQILSSAIAQTLVNIPADCKVAGSIEVKRLNGSARMQFYYPNWASSGTNPGSFYFRQRTGTTNWSAWYYFSGTQAASASAQSAPASLMQAGRLDAELTDAQEVTDDA